MSGPRVELRNLSAGYAPGEPALERVELEVGAGELVAVLGPNGGGKTTLFRALLGELPWVAGELRVEGEIAYVPQTERSRLDFPIDALGVALMGTYGSIPWYRRVRAAERERALAALDRVGLAAKARTAYGELSGGQRQRVLIARALAKEAPIVLLDEPLSGVDRGAATRVLELLGALAADGRIVLLSTHEVRHARIASSVLCLNREQIAFGPPSEALAPELLERTYGSELVVLGEGEVGVVHSHHHGEEGRR